MCYYGNESQKNQLWSGIKSVINIRKSSNVNVINKMKNSNGALTSDPVVIANLFNKFFVNVSHEITKIIPRTTKSPLEFIGNSICDSFFIAPSVP